MKCIQPGMTGGVTVPISSMMRVQLSCAARRELMMMRDTLYIGPATCKGAAIDCVRQHQYRGGQDTGRRQMAEDTGVLRVAGATICLRRGSGVRAKGNDKGAVEGVCGLVTETTSDVVELCGTVAIEGATVTVKSCRGPTVNAAAEVTDPV